VSIEIRDVNDHRPVFRPAEIVRELSESSQVGTTSIVIPTADDADSLPLSVQQYLIEQSADGNHDSDLFQIKVDDCFKLLAVIIIIIIIITTIIVVIIIIFVGYTVIMLLSLHRKFWFILS